MALAVGSDAPTFTVKDTNGNTVSLSDFKGKTVVLYFYPKDDTPGCTKQACSFRDAIDQYKSKDIVILGVSADDEVSHQAFAQKYNLNFPLLADTDKSLIQAYDVDGGGYAKRVTYVIDGNGKIIDRKRKSQYKAADHARTNLRQDHLAQRLERSRPQIERRLIDILVHLFQAWHDTQHHIGRAERDMRQHDRRESL